MVSQHALQQGDAIPACLVVGGGVSAPGGSMLRGVCSGGTAPGGGCLVETPPGGYCCERYASYWNAFLLSLQSITLVQRNLLVLTELVKGETQCNNSSSCIFDDLFRVSLLPPQNEVWGKVMFLQASVCPGGVSVQVQGGLRLGPVNKRALRILPECFLVL